MGTLEFIQKKYNLKLDQPSPIEIPNVDRNGLAAMFAELGFTVGVEIGTHEGEYAEDLCRVNSALTLYCVDPWEIYSEYTDIWDADRMALHYERAVERLAKFNCNLIRKYSRDAVKDFADGSLDFVYIDGNHDYPHVVEDICAWQKKVKRQGIIAGHDYVSYIDQENSHIVEAVTGYTKAYRVNPWFILGRKKKVRGELRDRYRSWMFTNNGVYGRHDFPTLTNDY